MCPEDGVGCERAACATGGAVVAGLAPALTTGLAAQALATFPTQKKARTAGLPAANCLYCHGEAVPKKGASTYNARRMWLIAEKEKRQAAEVAGAWLKDCVEPAGGKK